MWVCWTAHERVSGRTDRVCWTRVDIADGADQALVRLRGFCTAGALRSRSRGSAEAR